MRRLTFLLVALGLSGCGGGDLDDLQQFVTETGKDVQGKIEPLPEVKVYEPFTYGAFDLPDPFKPRKLSSGGGAARSLISRGRGNRSRHIRWRR